MVLGQNLEQARPLLREQREVFHEIEEAHRVADAPEHDLQRDTRGSSSRSHASLEEPLPVRCERADAALDAVEAMSRALYQNSSGRRSAGACSS